MVSEKEVSPNESLGAEPPLILVPVTAEDFARRSRRRKAAWVAAALAIAILAVVIHTRAVAPVDAKESYDAGERLYRAARYTQASLSLDRAIALKPDFTDAYYLRAQANLADSKLEHATLDFTKLIQLEPGNPRGLLGRGFIHLETEEFAFALAYATRAIELDPKLAPAYNLRALAARGAGDPRRALEDFTRALDLAPVGETYFQRGATHQMLGQHQLALADFDRAIAIFPDAAPLYFARAESRLAVGDLQGAHADRQRGRTLDGK
jgi:tetratricopeptide (TPR) repeat protein